MNKKAYRAARAEIERNGGEIRNLDHGQKHEIITADFGGFLVYFGFSRGSSDEVHIRQIVRNTLKRARQKQPAQHDVGNGHGEGHAGVSAQDPQERT